MKEYICFEIGQEGEDTQKMLNDYAKKGWKLICSYAKYGLWLIMEREAKVCSKCGVKKNE